MHGSHHQIENLAVKALKAIRPHYHCQVAYGVLTSLP